MHELGNRTDMKTANAKPLAALLAAVLELIRCSLV